MPAKLKNEFSEQVTVRMDDKMYRALAEKAGSKFFTIAQYIRQLIRNDAMDGRK